jgi:hypothetical protein
MVCFLMASNIKEFKAVTHLWGSGFWGTL